MTSVTKEKIQLLVTQILSKRAPLPANILEIDQFDYVEKGIVDSFGLISLVSELEDELDIELEESDFLQDNFRQVNGLIDILFDASSRQ